MGFIATIKSLLGGATRATKSRRHLIYDSVEAWFAGERLPHDFSTHPDPAQQHLWWRQLAELKQHLWQKHLSSLTVDEQKEFKEGIHPSQSHRYVERAEPFRKLLEEHLASLGIKARVKPGLYHGDRIVLTARLSELPPGGLPGTPWFFHGFEVKAFKSESSPEG